MTVFIPSVTQAVHWDLTLPVAISLIYELYIIKSCQFLVIRRIHIKIRLLTFIEKRIQSALVYIAYIIQW